MTVTVSTPETSFVLSGAGLGPFSTGWPYELAAEVQVYLVTSSVAVLLDPTDYALSGDTPLTDGGAVTLSETVLPEDDWDSDIHQLVLQRATPLTQIVPFGDFESFRPSTSEAAYDRLTRALQDMRRDLSAAVVLPPGSDTARVSKLLGWDDDGVLTFYTPGEGGGGGGGAVDSVAGLTGAISAASLRTALNLSTYYMPKAGGTFTGAVSGVTPTLDAHLATKAYVDAATGDSLAGVQTVVLDAENGTVDLQGCHGKLVKLVWAEEDDANIWKFINLPAGGWVDIIAEASFGLLFKAGFWGAQKIFGNFEGADAGDATNALAALPFNGRDVVRVHALNDDDDCFVYLASNQYIGRPLPPGAGSGQNPDGALFSLGAFGRWSADRGAPFGDFLMYTSGTVGKPITAGLVTRGRGDTAAIFLETYDVDEDGYLIPWDEVGKIGNHITFRSMIGEAGGLLHYNFTTPAPGGPGSLHQGFHCQFDMYAGPTMPTAASTPGGITIRTTPPGDNSPIDRLDIGPTGRILHFGKAAMEIEGDLGDCITSAAARFAIDPDDPRTFRDDNIFAWHAPAFYVNRLTEGFRATDVWVATPMEDYRTDFWAQLGFYEYDNLDRRAVFGWRKDEGIHWWMGGEGDDLGRCFGVNPDWHGLMLGPGTSERFSRLQSWEPQVADDTAVSIPLRPGRRGLLFVSIDNGTGAIFSISSNGSNCTKLTGDALFNAATGVLTGTSSTDGKMNFSVSGDRLYLENRLGSISNVSALPID